MERSDREKKLRSMLACKESFNVTQPSGKYKLVKKIGRKLTFWYVRPFGEAQNQFNHEAASAINAVSEALTELSARVDALETQTVHSLSDLAREQRESLARAQISQKKSITALADDISLTMSAVAPEHRIQAGLAPLTQLPAWSADVCRSELQAVQQAVSNDETEAALDVFEHRYTAALSDVLQKQTAARFSRPLTLVCRDFSAGGAAADEAWELCCLLKRASRYPACILSIEEEGTAASQRGNVHFVPEKLLGAWLNAHDPALLIFCDPSTAILTAGGQTMMLRGSMVRLSGQDPARLLGGSTMQELLHLCDLGVQRYVTASRAAADTMESLGFRRPAVLYPYIDTNKPHFFRRPRPEGNRRFTVGYAFPPCSEEESAERGIPALCKIVQQQYEMDFVVIWSDVNAAPVPETLRTAANCRICGTDTGMAAFCSEIDCLLVPFAGAEHDPAIPRIAAEAMLMGIPVVAPPESGIAELIAASGIGETAADSSATSLFAALKTVQDHLHAYGAAWQLEKLRPLLDGKAFVRMAEQYAASPVPYGICTLYEWDRRLKTGSRHLIRGEAALKAYFQRREPETKVPAYPQACYDRMERSAVAALLQTFFPKRSDLYLLDAASGSGTILPALLPLGHCTAGDASPAMTDALQSRFAGEKQLTLRRFDLLSQEIAGEYDAVTVFRYLRHCEYKTRRILWAKLRNALRDGGILLFDVPNAMFEIPNRRRIGWEHYRLYDVFWTPDLIRRELADQGMTLEALIPIGEGLYPESEGCPPAWVAAAKRNS